MATNQKFTSLVIEDKKIRKITPYYSEANALKVVKK